MHHAVIIITTIIVVLNRNMFNWPSYVWLYLMFLITCKKTNTETVTLSFNVFHMARWQSRRNRHNAITELQPLIFFILSLSWTMNLRARLCFNVSSYDTAWQSKSKSNIRLMALSWTRVNTKSWNQALQIIDHTVVLVLGKPTWEKSAVFF